MQPPAGYPQHPQGQPQGQPYPQGPQQAPPGYGPQQGYPPQYAMQQQPYYPPQKKGMPGWAWALIIGGILLFCGFPILGILLLPMVTSNTRDARRAEGEQLMGSAKDWARVEYSKTGQNPRSFSSFGALYQFSGMYYSVDDTIRDVGPSGDWGSTRAEITCTPVSMSDGKGHNEFGWADGSSTVRWD